MIFSSSWVVSASSTLPQVAGLLCFKDCWKSSHSSCSCNLFLTPNFDELQGEDHKVSGKICSNHLLGVGEINKQIFSAWENLWIVSCSHTRTLQMLGEFCAYHVNEFYQLHLHIKKCNRTKENGTKITKTGRCKTTDRLQKKRILDFGQLHS